MIPARLAVHAGVLVVVFAAAGLAAAAEYGGETVAENDDELAALAAAGELDAEALEALQALHDAPPRAAEALADELALLPGVSRAQARKRAGLRTGAESTATPTLRFDAQALKPGHEPTQGFVRMRLAPAAAWAAGALVVTRDRTRFTMSADRLTSDGPRREVGLERWHGTATVGPLRIVLGSFNCDFADSLTFSSARRLYAPTLALADDVARAIDAQSLRAVAALRGLAFQLDTDALEATVFGSYRAIDLYQYGEWLHDDESPAILERGSGDGLRYQTLAGAARETLLGGNLEVRFGEQAFGATAYAGMARLADPMGRWSPSSVYPATAGFGAVGAHTVVQFGLLRARGEVTRTLTGGLGAVARLEWAFGEDCDLSLSARHYGVSFDNPFARSVAEPDVWEGARARNERGVELATAIAVGGFLRLAASADVWSALTSPGAWNGRARGRTTWSPTDQESVVLEGECVDKDLRYGGAYAGASCATSEPDCARGARATGTARVVTERIWRTRLALGVRHTRQDVEGGVVQETRLTGHLTVRPLAGLSLALVASERLSARAPEIDGARRLVALTISAAREWGSVDLMMRSESRWDGHADVERATASGALSVTLQL